MQTTKNAIQYISNSPSLIAYYKHLQAIHMSLICKWKYLINVLIKIALGSQYAQQNDAQLSPLLQKCVLSLMCVLKV